MYMIPNKLTENNLGYLWSVPPFCGTQYLNVIHHPLCSTPNTGIMKKTKISYIRWVIGIPTQIGKITIENYYFHRKVMFLSNR